MSRGAPVLGRSNALTTERFQIIEGVACARKRTLERGRPVRSNVGTVASVVSDGRNGIGRAG